MNKKSGLQCKSCNQSSLQFHQVDTGTSMYCSWTLIVLIEILWLVYVEQCLHSLVCCISQDSYTSVTVERGYVVVQGRQGTQVLNAKSTRKVSLNVR